MTKQPFSIIIPTLWVSPRINYTVSCMVDLDSVDEIIIIDNNPKHRNLKIQSPKIHILEQEQNIYVNPAWNLGVKTAKNDNLCIINDDILFDSVDVFEFIEDHMDKGIIGMHTNNYYGDVLADGKYFVQQTGNGGMERGWGWGCMLFIKKSNWVEIPEDLKIACGDDYLVQNVKGNAWHLANLYLYTDKISVTTGKFEFREQQAKDIELYKTKYDKSK